MHIIVRRQDTSRPGTEQGKSQARSGRARTCTPAVIDRCVRGTYVTVGASTETMDGWMDGWMDGSRWPNCTYAWFAAKS